ncbi:MAG: FAD/NAD(P)-binding oxidoreductase [Acidimicrobiia bacterium]
MQRLVILGAGTAGSMVANKLRPLLSRDEWSITVVDPATEHHYQPGYLFVPFGTYRPEQVTKPIRRFIPDGVEFLNTAVARVESAANTVHLADGSTLGYDQLIVATGTHPRPDETPGLEGPAYRDTIHDFYSLEGATALGDALARFEGGKLVVNLIELPIKCPVAPLEFTFLADAYFTERGIRDQVEITYVTPLEGAFTKPVAAEHLGAMFESKHIEMEPDFYLERVDPDERKLVSFDEREVSYDLLVTVPLNFGAEFLADSDLPIDELRHIGCDHATFLVDGTDNVFALGDAANLPTSKAGSVAHFAVDVFTHNFLQHIAGRPMTEAFDGHANCYIESGHGKALLIDFNYDTQPLPGKFPLPGVGPFSLLEETEMNHWGKMMFKWIYWNILVPGKELPLPAHMSMYGKVEEPV